MVVPHEVPLGPRVFVNRLPDFARMDEFWSAEADTARVGICNGLPGVGKTAFVRRCVQRVRDGEVFSGGDLYVDFGPVGGERLSVADALASCLTALGVTRDVLPTSLAGRANHLRSLTAQKPVLIVLEDVTDPAQVLPFLPNSPASAVLVTSSSQLSELRLDGAESISLDPLDEVAGAHLLVELVGARVGDEPSAVAELVDRCAGLPVALKVAAARLLARPALRVGDLVAEIADDDRGLEAFAVRGQDKVSAVFSVAYDALSLGAASLYRQLGLFPGRDLTIDTVVALLGRSVRSAQAAVEELVEAGLLTEDATRRLSLHRMVRRHAAQLAERHDDPDHRDAALRRVVRHLLVKVAFADLAELGAGRYRVTPPELTGQGRTPFSEPGSAIAWLDRERGNLLAVQKLAAEYGWHEECWQLAEGLTALYVTRRYLADWIESSKHGARSANLAGNARAEARLRSFVSRAWTDVGDLVRAGDELITQALPLAEAAGDSRLLASVWELIGRLRDETDPTHAEDAYNRAIALFLRENDVRGVAFVSLFLGASQHRTGQADRAVGTLSRSLDQIREVGNSRMEGRCLVALAAALADTGYAGMARSRLDEAIELLGRTGHTYYEAQAHECLVALAEQTGDSAVVRGSLRRMAELHRDLGSPRVDELTERLRQLDEA